MGIKLKSNDYKFSIYNDCKIKENFHPNLNIQPEWVNKQIITVKVFMHLRVVCKILRRQIFVNWEWLNI